MDKLNMQSKNILSDNLEFIQSRFPNVITETKDENGNLTRKVDFELLAQELSGEIVEGNKERYQLTWPGKKEAILTANTPINKTLRPVIEDSVDFENTENLYIEGDNLEVLKLLQESYLGKIKCIFIDPPYNRGTDLVYRDDFRQNTNEYLEESGQIDEDGNWLFENTKSNGRFHSDWLSMMYSRLKLSRNLLNDAGVIFIAIDDNEMSNLKKICNEVFGEDNYISTFLWKKKSTSTNTENTKVSPLTDYILVYSKSDKVDLKQRVRLAETRKYPYKDDLGNFRTTIIEKKDSGQYKRDTMKYEILGIKPREGKRWQIGIDKARELEKKGRFLVDENGVIKLKIYDFEDKNTTSAHPNILEDFGSTDSASKYVNKELFNKDELFSNPKPIELLKFLFGISMNSGDIAMDFFSGSASSADAIMHLNKDDKGSRKYIMVQVPERTKEKSEAYKEGYSSICEIGKERIRRAAQKIKQETNADIDYGFRVYKVDSTNMKDTYYNVEEISQANLFKTESNIKEDRTPEDLLTQVILDLGLELSLKIEEKNINGKKVFYVDEDSLVACFDEGVDKELAMEIAKDMPMKVVFRDSCFSDDSIKENIKEIFKKYSNDTDIKVL